MKRIPAAEPLIRGNELKYVDDCIKSTWLSHGKYMDLFEKRFAKFCDVQYATSVVNGTAALHLLLASLGIGKGDEVIVPDLTFVATVNAVSYTGAKPVLVDVDRRTWNIDPKKIEENITSRTKAIIVVHLYGYPADMNKINSLAKVHNIYVLEDACEAHGAIYRGKKVGSLGHAACFSFYGNKIITTGEGGMIVSNNKALIEKAAYLKSHAQIARGKFSHTAIGFNYRFTNLQSALGLAQLEDVDYVLKVKRRNAETYNSLLKDINILMLSPSESGIKSAFWMYSIVLKKENLRDKLSNELDKVGIETRPFFDPMHELPMYRQKGNFSNSVFLSKNGLNLPSAATLKTQDAERICNAIKKILKKIS